MGCNMSVTSASTIVKCSSVNIFFGCSQGDKNLHTRILMFEVGKVIVTWHNFFATQAEVLKPNQTSLSLCSTFASVSRVITFTKQVSFA